MSYGSAGSGLQGATFSIVNLGCKVNRVESDEAANVLESCGCVHVSPEAADIIVVNTCTVTAEADKKARKAVRHCLARNSSAHLVVTGCAVAINPDKFRGMDGRVSVVPKPELNSFLSTVALQMPGRGICGEHDGCDDGIVSFGRTRVGLKIQDGCNNSCTYCIVCIARGPAYSVPLQDVIKRAQGLARSGVREIVLSGIDLGAYRYEGKNLYDILSLLLEETGKYTDIGEYPTRFRISSIEPASIDSHLLELIASSDGRVCPHLHIPLQSGSDKVLSEMGRQYCADGYIDLVSRIRNTVPGVAITTDVIAGFPGETEADFADTVQLCRSAGFSSMHVFPYSKRTGTVAAERADQVQPDVKQQRAQTLRRLAKDMRSADAQRRMGTEELFLVQEDGAMMSGSYFELPAPQDAPVGRLIRTIFDRMPL